MGPRAKPKKFGCLLWLIGIPFLEAGLLILTVKWLGAGMTFSLLIGVSAVGILLCVINLAVLSTKLRAIKAKIARAKAEGSPIDLEAEKKKAMAEAVPGMIPFLFAVVLFLIPGFITDGLGFWMISPFARGWIENIVKNNMKKKKTSPPPPPPLRPRAGGGPSFSYTPK